MMPVAGALPAVSFGGAHAVTSAPRNSYPTLSVAAVNRFSGGF